MIVVQKYGGTSLSTPEKRKYVAEKIIRAQKRGLRPVVVVSAIGRLGEPYATDTLISLLKEAGDIVEKRELDLMLSCGEIISAVLMAHILKNMGYPAVALTGAQAGIETEDAPGQARIKTIKTERILSEISKDRIVVIAGFQGVTKLSWKWGDITTLGRGGSDTTAVALAAALKIDSCEIFTDVDGIFTTDPKIKDAGAKLLPFISYQEALELAACGGKVIHPRAVEIAEHFNIKILVRNSQTENPGTTIGGETMEKMEIYNRVKCISTPQKVALITICELPNTPGIACRIACALTQAKINFSIIQGGSVLEKADMSFLFEEKDFETAKKILEKMTQELKAKKMVTKQGLARVSIIGTGVGHPEHLYKTLKALARAKINNFAIDTTQTRLSVVIDESQGNIAINVLHKTFKLNK